MPVKIERKLKAEARKRGLKGKKFNAYVYGTLNKIAKMERKGGK